MHWLLTNFSRLIDREGLKPMRIPFGFLAENFEKSHIGTEIIAKKFS